MVFKWWNCILTHIWYFVRWFWVTTVSSLCPWNKHTEQFTSSFCQARSKSTPKFFAYENISLGEVHQVWVSIENPVWVSTENSVMDVSKAIVKTRILLGTCLLQANIHIFSQYCEDPMCKLCKQQKEEIFYTLLYCPLLTETKRNYYEVLRDFDKLNTIILSQCMRFPTMGYVRPAKPQISLRIRAVWSEPLHVAWAFYDC